MFYTNLLSVIIFCLLIVLTSIGIWIFNAHSNSSKLKKIYKYQKGDMVIGTVKHMTRSKSILSLDNHEDAIMPFEYQIPNEVFKVGDKVHCYIYEIKENRNLRTIMVSRTHQAFLPALFEKLSPEISKKEIEIKAISREPGIRSKLAVKTNNSNTDPILTIIGGHAAMNIMFLVKELKGERFDIVLWHDDPKQLVINAMSPAKVLSVKMNEETHSMNVVLDQDEVSLEYSEDKKHIQMASELSGWTLNID